MPAIDVGSPVIGRSTNAGATWTYIWKDNPANLPGIIDTVEIQARGELTDCEVALFEETSTDTFTTRSNVLLGTVVAGSKQTFSGLTLAVEAGDYIGQKFSSGLLAIEVSGGQGDWYKTGDYISCTNEVFIFEAGLIADLYGFGTSETHYGVATLLGIGTLSAIGRRLTLRILTCKVKQEKMLCLIGETGKALKLTTQIGGM